MRTVEITPAASLNADAGEELSGALIRHMQRETIQPALNEEGRPHVSPFTLSQPCDIRAISVYTITCFMGHSEGHRELREAWRPV